MNKFVALCTSAILGCGLYSAAANASTAGDKLEPYITYNDTYYQNNQIIDKYLGDIIAVKGKVLKIEKGPEDKIIFQIKLAGIDKTVWVATIMNVLEDAIKIGDNIRVLGYFDETAQETKFMTKLSTDKEYVIGFCFNVDNSGLPIYFTHFMKRCVQWETGQSFQDETVIGSLEEHTKRKKEQEKTTTQP